MNQMHSAGKSFLESDIQPSAMPDWGEGYTKVGQELKIAVLRSNGIGDFVFAIPALEALRASYPESEIVYLGLQWHKEFLEGRPGPWDRVVVVPMSRGVSLPDYVSDDEGASEDEMQSFFKSMQDENFDVALQMHGGGRFSNPFTKRLGANLTVGLRSPGAAPLDRWVPYHLYQPEIMRYLEVVSLIGAEQAMLEPKLHVTEEDVLEAEAALRPSPGPIAVLHPGAGDARRRWPVEKFAVVGNAIAWAGAQVVVVGGDADTELDATVVDAMAASALNLQGKLSLGGLLGLLSMANVVVSNDSGPLHLAAAVGTPTVGIFWCGNVITAAPVTRGQNRLAIAWRLECPVCGANIMSEGCVHDRSIVADVSQEEVIEAALELLRMTEKHLQ